MAAAVGRLTEIGYRAAILWVLDSNGRARRFCRSCNSTKGASTDGGHSESARGTAMVA
jgi:hypothetical protein